MTYSSHLRALDREEVKRLQRKLARIQLLLYQAFGDVYLNAPDGSSLAEIRDLLRGPKP